MYVYKLLWQVNMSMDILSQKNVMCKLLCVPGIWQWCLSMCILIRMNITFQDKLCHMYSITDE